MSLTIINADCRDAMRDMEPNFIDSIVTDPPYGLKFMGKGWDHGVPGGEFWIEALRVAKPGAHLLAFGGTRTHHRLMCAIEDAGWDIRDCLGWLYGSGFPKSHNGPWGGTALKPAWEPIILARKPLDGTVAANVERWGCGGVNVDGCRVGTETVQSGGGALGTNGIYGGMVRDKSTAGTVTGRWPANILHDGSDEVLGVFPQTGPSPQQYEKKKAGWLTPGSTHAENELQSREYGDSGTAARFFYCAKASKADRDEGCEGIPERPKAEHEGRNHSLNSGYRMENGIATGPKADSSLGRNHHPTVKPTALMRYLCRLITPAGGLVLDPFCGSGSTGKAAAKEGFNFIGIELNPEYAAIARARIATATQQELF